MSARGACGLTAVERDLIVRAAVLLVAVRVGLAVASFEAVRQRLAARARSRRRTAPRIAPARVGRLVEAVGRRFPGVGTCLTHALVAQHLLGRMGVASRVHLGVKRPLGRALGAHAWVECRHRIVVGAIRDLGRYAPLVVLDHQPAVRLSRARARG